MIHKIMTLEEASIRHHRGTILVTGCFDIIHVGHVRLFEHAGMLADRFCMPVAVGINSDRAVRELKGPTRPVNDYHARATVVAGFMWIDVVFEIDDIRVSNAIRLMAPLTWLKGGDYTLETLDKDEVAAAKSVDAKISIFETVPGYSTTNILKRANEHTPP